MFAEVTHPETGEKYTVDIPALTEGDLDDMLKEYTQDEEIRAYIERLPVSAEVKALLFKLSKFTINVGGTVVRLGKKIVEVAIMLANKYKNTTLGLIIGAILTVLIAGIPWIGSALSGFLGPLLMLIGITKGLWEDLKKDSPQLATSVVESCAVFQPLSPQGVIGS